MSGGKCPDPCFCCTLVASGIALNFRRCLPHCDLHPVLQLLGGVFQISWSWPPCSILTAKSGYNTVRYVAQCVVVLLYKVLRCSVPCRTLSTSIWRGCTLWRAQWRRFLTFQTVASHAAVTRARMVSRYRYLGLSVFKLSYQGGYQYVAFFAPC